jgi:hypothetical protein
MELMEREEAGPAVCGEDIVQSSKFKVQSGSGTTLNFEL